MTLRYASPIRPSLLALAAVLILGLPDTLQAQPALLVEAPAATAARGATSDTALYDQISLTTTGGIASQVDADDPAFTIVAADDFVVPAGATWTVERVVARGFYTAQASEGDCTQAEVGFRAGGGNTPGAVIIAHTVAPTADAGGTLTLDIPATTLAAGEYWVSVVCSGESLRVVVGEGGTDRRWIWHLGDGARNRSAVVRNDGRGYGLPAGWNRLTSLNVSPPSFSFALYGAAAGSISTEGEGTRPVFVLSQNFPNPFSGRTRIAFETPSAGPVALTVYDALGRRVAALLDGELPAGRHEAEWDASGLASGVYLVRLQASEQAATLRALVVD